MRDRLGFLLGVHRLVDDDLLARIALVQQLVQVLVDGELLVVERRPSRRSPSSWRGPSR